MPLVAANALPIARWRAGVKIVFERTGRDTVFCSFSHIRECVTALTPSRPNAEGVVHLDQTYVGDMLQHPGGFTPQGLMFSFLLDDKGAFIEAPFDPALLATVDVSWPTHQGWLDHVFQHHGFNDTANIPCWG